MKKLVKLWCFIVGHNMINLYKMDNLTNYGRSYWGMHKCMRCGKEENWQYDF